MKIFFVPLILTITSLFVQPPAQANPVLITKVVNKCHEYKFTKAQCAYTLATIEHETAYTWKPVKEAFWLSEAWRKQNLRYYPYYGRGHIQLTWPGNYDFMGDRFEVDLINFPDLALEENLSLDIAFLGLKEGHFTGYRLSQFIINSLSYAEEARVVVNGNDKAKQIEQRSFFWFRQLTVY